MDVRFRGERVREDNPMLDDEVTRSRTRAGDEGADVRRLRWTGGGVWGRDEGGGSWARDVEPTDGALSS